MFYIHKPPFLFTFALQNYNLMKKIFVLLLLSIHTLIVVAQDSIPDVFTNIYYDKDCKLYHQFKHKKYYVADNFTPLTLSNLQGNPQATPNGIHFNFNNPNMSGTLYYGLINYKDSKYPTPVWFGRTVHIANGEAQVNILKRLSGRYDMSDWQNAGKGTLGYRVSNAKGNILYDGVIGFNYDKDQGFSIATTLLEGPFINLLKPTEVTISFETNKPVQASIQVENNVYADAKPVKHHEIKIDQLKPDTHYSYTVDYQDAKQNYTFTTAPLPGSRKAFVFGYTSDSRTGQGGGERDLYGVNYYVMRKMAALAKYKEAVFLQVTGDLVDGYMNNKEEMNLQYANWKRAVEPFAHHFPIIAAMGNHEAVGKIFRGEKGRWKAFIPAFPFETESAEAVFAKNFVNPHSDLISEDGAYYDPNPDKTDFPPYDETVFYYTYDNVAIIVLNSNYLYTPALKYNATTSGNLHGYIMDNQLKWLEKTLQKLEKDTTIDHIFVTQHTPSFPDGGHVKDDMWYNGDNSKRAVIAGKPLDKGIIERRDQYLDLLINKSTKVVATMTGDEHNYNKVKITPTTNIYPDKYPYPKLKRSRTLWQINNGAAGAPYYAQNKSTPWNNAVSGFSTQLALVLIYVDGPKVSVKVMNPDTLNMIDEYILRE